MSDTSLKLQIPCSTCTVHRPVTLQADSCMYCMHCPMTSQSNACSYCMSSVVLILSQIYLYSSYFDCYYPTQASMSVQFAGCSHFYPCMLVWGRTSLACKYQTWTQVTKTSTYYAVLLITQFIPMFVERQVHYSASLPPDHRRPRIQTA